jgi:phage/conjugal plasmid C-4 type zinc finger TraR family protein
VTLLERFADELDLAQFHMDQVTELAITAIRKGSGLAAGREYCLDCGGRIPAKRLVHVPNATRCAPCQGLHERRGTARSAN